MPTYSSFAYNDGTLYGEPSRIAFSAEPVVATPLDYGKVSINWAPPTGNIQSMRLVRNQDGFPETAEDGVILFEAPGAEGIAAPFVDGEDTPEGTIPLVEGRFAYYRIWLLRVDQNWYPAGDSVALVPKNHAIKTIDGTVLLTSQQKFMDILPRAFFSPQRNILDEADVNSTLGRFISAFSFTVDELYTYAETSLPNTSGVTLNPRGLPLHLVNYGLTSEPNIGIKGQKRLLREANYIYSRKGTLNALATMVESFSGYSPTISLSPNLMMSMEDSTFVDGLGFWETSGSAVVLTRVDDQSIASEQFAVDETWVGKVQASGSGSIKTGVTSPVTKGIPVDPGTEYSFSAYLRRESATSQNVTMRIRWFDKDGTLLSTSSSTATAMAQTWTKYSVTASAPGEKIYLDTGEITAGVATITTLSDHGFSVGDDVRLFDAPSEYSSFYGIVTITDVPSTTSFSFETTTTGRDEEDIYGTAVLLSGNENDGFKIVEAVYAGVEIEVNGAATYYVDMAQLSESSVTDYYEPRGVVIHLAPNKKNLVVNPSFNPQSSTSVMPLGWSLTPLSPVDATITHLVEDATLAITRSGSHMLGVSGTNGQYELSTTVTGIESGNFYTFSIYMEHEEDDKDVELSITAHDAGDPSTVHATASVDVTVTAGTWERKSVSVFIPASEDDIEITAKVTTTADADHLHFDSAQIEKSYARPSDYFDGNYNSIGAIWTGTENNSASYFYVNRDIKVDRLAATLPSYLPLKSPYVITIGDPSDPIIKVKAVS
jgi:hypothetical protein